MNCVISTEMIERANEAISAKREAWTYFVQPELGGAIKIGFTSKPPQSRLSGLQVGSPVKLRLIGLLEGNREHELHSRFGKHRLHGEWFHEHHDLVQFIAGECRQLLREVERENERWREEHTLLSIRKISNYLQVSERTVKCFIKNGELAVCPGSNPPLVTELSLSQFLESRKAPAVPGPPKSRLPKSRKITSTLTARKDGRWVKKIKGRTYYFTGTAEEAHAKFRRQFGTAIE